MPKGSVVMYNNIDRSYKQKRQRDAVKGKQHYKI